MTRRRSWTLALAVCALPIVSLADVTGSPTLAVNTTLNLDTGATAATGGDLLWTGAALTPQGGAGLFLIGTGGTGTYDALTQSLVSGIPTSTASVPASSILSNSVFVFKSKGGNFGKMLINAAISGGTLTLQFTTFGAIAPGGGPAITAVQNNYGQVPQGLPNYGIAPSTLFFIQGGNLANVTTDLQSSAAPGLQTTLNGVSVKVTVGSTSVQCPLYYLSPTQIDAVLPGSTPAGTGTVTVTNNGATSAAATITVVPSAFGILFYNGNLAAAYDGSNALLTTTNSANPNQTIVLWGSGVGLDPNDDDKLFPQKQDNLTSIPMQAFVGGVEAPISYRGRSQYPGVDQVVLTIPGNVAVGCNVAVSIVSGSIVSNSVTIPIAASGHTCTDANGFPPGVISGLNGKTTIKEGFLSVSQTTSITNSGPQVTNSAVGSFQTITNFNSSSSGSASVGSCLVINSLQSVSAGTVTGLDAGTAIAVTGPAGLTSLTQIALAPGTYFSAANNGTLPIGFIPTAGGTFTFDNGGGGKDVAHFNASLNVGPVLNWTNQASITSVTRTQPVNVTWTGGAAGTFVSISGGSSTTTGKSFTVSFTCIAPVAAGQFTVPVNVLLALPAGTGSLSVSDSGNFQTFTASGLDLGIVSGSSSTSKTLGYN
jgi:uncharacterized protein (TIGR03437 family)